MAYHRALWLAGTVDHLGDALLRCAQYATQRSRSTTEAPPSFHPPDSYRGGTALLHSLGVGSRHRYESLHVLPRTSGCRCGGDDEPHGW